MEVLLVALVMLKAPPVQLRREGLAVRSNEPTLTDPEDKLQAVWFVPEEVFHTFRFPLTDIVPPLTVSTPTPPAALDEPPMSALGTVSVPPDSVTVPEAPGLAATNCDPPMVWTPPL